MSLVDTETGEPVVLMDKAAALKITAEIKAWAGTLWLKIEEAHRGQAWRALGYESWAAYLDAEFDIGKSRGYQLVNHARAVRSLAEAAGVESTMVDLPERVTRAIDVEATAADIADEAAVLPDDVDVQVRVGLVRKAAKRHAKTAGAGVGPMPSPAEQGPQAPAPSAPPAEDEDDEPQAASDGDRPAGEVPPPPVDPYPDLTFAVNASKAAARIYEDIEVLDPERLASDAAEDRADWLALADHLTAKADAIRSAFVRPHLEAVR